MDTKTLVWRCSQMNTIELLKLESGNEYRVNSLIIGELEGKPVQVSYKLVINNDWHIQSVSLMVESDQLFKLNLKKEENKWYEGQGKHLPELDGTIDIDISLTPFTNTLPIRRLHIPEGRTEEINVVYFNLPSVEIKPMKQYYTNMGNGSYKYESPGFESILKTDAEGFVTDYPGIWQMVYPQKKH
jgi:uncharacterized protein